MTSAVWRPNRRESYPVLGIESYCGDLVEAVVELPATGPNLITVPVEDIRVSPTRSIVRALTAEFQDHSSPDRCRCAERAEGQLTPLSPRAQPDPGGEAGSGTNFQKGDVE